MADTIKTPSGHSCVALYDQPHGTVTETLLFTDPDLEDRLQARLRDAQEAMMLSQTHHQS